jgi:hypothetical protein
MFRAVSPGLYIFCVREDRGRGRAFVRRFGARLRLSPPAGERFPFRSALPGRNYSETAERNGEIFTVSGLTNGKQFLPLSVWNF